MMKQKIFKIAALLITLLGVFQVNAFADEVPFQVSAKSTFSLTWRGKHITNDKLFSDRGAPNTLPTDPLTIPEGYRSETINGETVQNTWQLKDIRREVTYRREVASDGKRVEVTAQFRVPAYYFDGKSKTLQVFYGFAIPLEALADMKYQAVVREAGKFQTVSGVVTPGTKPQLGTQVLFITFEDKNGHHLSFDFGQTGVTSFDWNTSATTIPESWWGGSDAKEMRFSVGRLQNTTYPYNGVYNGKVIIDESTFAQWQQRHAHHIYQYFMELPPIYQFSLGAGQLDSEWLQTNTGELPESAALQRKHDQWIPARQQITASANFGWKDTSRIQTDGDISKGVLEGAAKSTFAREFDIRVSQPGIYIFTLRTKARNKSVGPFSVTANGEIAAQNVKADTGEIKTITFSRYITDGLAKIQFSGDWAVSTIAVQFLINQFEDLTFKRGLWLAENIPTPSTLFQRQRTPFTPLAAVQDISDKALTKNAPKTDAPLQIDFSADENNPALDWRWTSNISAFGTGLKGSFYEFETDEEINRRLDELQKLGYTTIILNGLHIRYAWPDQLPRVDAAIARIVKLAHQRQMKVLDHFSATIVPNLNDSFRLALDHPDWLLRDVRNGQITRGFCINNPHFQEFYYKFVTDHVKATHLDGIMLDEISLQRDLYCGCQYCRAKFHHDTGLTIPTNEHDPNLFNPDSRLWRQWLLWRAESKQEFRTGLMKELRTINPDFFWMSYSAPVIFMGRDGVFRWNGRYSETPRSSNFMGIESLTNNVYANFRSKFAIANIFNSITAKEHIPGFDLTYPQGQPVFAYAGWALNNMTGHRTWLEAGSPAIAADAPRYIDWKDNMNIRRATQVADVAVLFSRSTRDFSPQAEKYKENEDLKGIVQELADLNIPYKVVLDRDLSLQELQKYHLLIMPNTSAMADNELEIIRQYLEAGGNVIATATTGMQDNFGFPRQEWVIGKWLGLENQGEFANSSTVQGELTDNQPLQYPDKMIRVHLQKDSAAKVLLRAQQGDATGIAAVEKQIGKGKLLWTAMGFGSVGFEPYAKSGVTWKYQNNAEVLRLWGNTVASMRGEKPVFQAVQMPQYVLNTIFRQREENGKITTLVHLYNGTGAALKKGEKIPKVPPKIAFPKLTKDIIFEIELPGKSTFTADIVSPDYKDARAVDLQPLGDSRYRVTVPKEDLQAYGMVRIREN